MKAVRSKTFIGIERHTIEDYSKNNTADYLSAITNDAKMIEDNYLLPLLQVIQYTIIFSNIPKIKSIKPIAQKLNESSDYRKQDTDSLSVLDIDKITALSSVIHQNVYMFDESIFDNICLHEDFSKDELQSVLSDSGLSQFIEQVPNGLKYHVGENGDNLSGGQKQKAGFWQYLI